MTKKLLQEVNIIRPFVITLLVLMHSFAIYAGGWPKPDGVEQIEIYKWFTWFITGFRIETIAFIAGYVFSYQANDLGRKYTIWGIIKKKFVRLVIPCWVFGIVYALCFARTNPIIENIFSIINGIGHLWFLTMLFWCFVLLVLIDRVQSYKKARWIVFFILMMISCIPIPTQLPLLGFRRVPHFLFYAYVGYLFYIYKDKIYSFFKNNRYWLILIIYIFCVILSNAVLPPMRHRGSPLFLEISIYGLLKVSQLLSALSGIVFVYMVVMNFLKRKREQYNVPEYVNQMNKMCYGVYIFHQFILMYIYYYTDIPNNISSYVLPILSFIFTIALSVVLSKTFISTKVGRFLIG